MKVGFVDYDGTLVNFLEEIVKHINENENTQHTPLTISKPENKKLISKYIDLIKYGDLKQLSKVINENENTQHTPESLKEDENKPLRKQYLDEIPNYYDGVGVFEEALDFINILNQDGYEIVIVTSSMSSFQKEGKIKHIDKHFNGLISDVIHARKKHPKTQKGKFFLDDNVDKILEHCKYNKELLEQGVINNEVLGILYNHKGMHYYEEEDIQKLNEYSNFRYIENYNDVLKEIGVDIKIEKDKTNDEELVEKENYQQNFKK